MQINNINSSISFTSLKSQKLLSEKMMRIYHQTYPYKFHSNTWVFTLAQKAEAKGKEELAKKLNAVIEKYYSEIIHLRESYEDDYDSWQSAINALKENVVRTKAANCGEQSLLLQDVFLKNNEEAHRISLDIVNKSTGQEEGMNHAFLLKGAKKDANLCDPKTWGNEAVIVDPWCNFVVDAKEGIEHFKKVLNFNPEKETMNFGLCDLIDIKAYLEGRY